MPTNEQIREYLKGTVLALDGDGIIVTNEALIDTALEECEDFIILRSMFDNSIPQPER